ncbi:exodeoxyribonuclease VII small subunit [Candidatus Poribacteria bacterium]|nr:exodeoxyribonuclease VII small subunit [Candidatus Poribacteria bacterium]
MKEKIKFEEALDKLEKIIEELENGKLSLDESLSAFEEGIKLSRICQKYLDEAERKIEILVKGEDGQLKLANFDSDLKDQSI